MIQGGLGFIFNRCLPRHRLPRPEFPHGAACPCATPGARHLFCSPPKSQTTLKGTFGWWEYLDISPAPGIYLYAYRPAVCPCPRFVRARELSVPASCPSRDLRVPKSCRCPRVARARFFARARCLPVLATCRAGLEGGSLPKLPLFFEYTAQIL